MGLYLPQKIPGPDIEDLMGVLRGKKELSRLHNIEVIVDEEIKEVILRELFNSPYWPMVGMYESHKNELCYEDYQEAKQNYYLMNLDFHKKMGYSIIADHEFFINFEGFNSGVYRMAKDTAGLPRDKRAWAQEGQGLIRDWKDFENFPWKDAERLLDQYDEHLDFMERILPDNMKIAVVGAVNAIILDWMLGFEGLFYQLYDNFDLVSAIYDKLGHIIHKMYKIAASKKCVAVLWHGDDLAFKTSTMLSTKHLNKLLFPWMKKYAETAHNNKKDFWVHCCGYKENLMDFFIDELKIDALHSFEDTCAPVKKYKKEYGDKIAILGGVDMNKLASFNSKDLKDYIDGIARTCVKGGRYALGSGNSITNYTPLENYITMLEIGNNWFLK